MSKRKSPPRKETVAPPGAAHPARATSSSPALVCLVLALATALSYYTVATHGFVDYDDGDYVSANPQVETGLTPQNIAWAFTTGHASNWHPLTWISHMLDYQLFGRNPGAQHLINVAFHIANSLVLFLLLRRLTGAHWRSAMVAALFALHPLHVESVAWLSERKDVLSTLFLFLTLAAYAEYARGKNLGRGRGVQILKTMSGAPGSSARDPKSTAAHARWFFALALVCFALGLMSKPMLVTVPFLLLVLDYWPLNRAREASKNKLATAAPTGTNPADREPARVDFALWWRLVIEKLPFFTLAIASSAVTFVVQRKGGAVSTALTLGQRTGNALISYVRYLWKMLWPENLAVLYPHPGTWPWWQVVACGLLLAGIFTAVVWLARSRPYVLVGWCWFFGLLVPVIGLVQVGIQSMADRYTYVPLVGIFVALVWGVGDLARQWNWRREALAFGAFVLLSTLSLLTMRQAGYWRDTETLFSHAVEVEPKNYLAYNNLGYYYANHGKPSQALENYRKSLDINPNYEDALNNMGHALAQQQRHAEAIPYYEAALRVRPLHVEVHNNLGNALSELGRIDEAIGHYRIALQQNPNHADAHNNLGIALAMKGNLDEAIPHFREAIRLKRDYASAHSNLGNAFAAEKKWDDAIQQYQECLRLNPQDPQAYNNLGNVLSQLGKLDESVTNYTQALRLRANNPEAHFNLAFVLLRLGRRDEARSHFQEALRLRPDYTEAKRQLTLMDSAPN